MDSRETEKEPTFLSFQLRFHLDMTTSEKLQMTALLLAAIKALQIENDWKLGFAVAVLAAAMLTVVRKIRYVLKPALHIHEDSGRQKQPKINDWGIPNLYCL